MDSVTSKLGSVAESALDDAGSSVSKVLGRDEGTELSARPNRQSFSINDAPDKPTGASGAFGTEDTDMGPIPTPEPAPAPPEAQIEPDRTAPTQQYRPDELPQLKDSRKNLFRHRLMQDNSQSLDEMRANLLQSVHLLCM